MYRKLMVPLDGSKLAEHIFPHLENLVKCITEVPEVWLVQAVELSLPVGREVSRLSSLDEVQEYETHQKRDAEKYLSDTAAYFSERGISTKVEVITGKAGDTLVEYVKKNNIDLIAMATHGRSGIKSVLLGSVAQKLLNSVEVPVLLIRPRTGMK